MTEGSDPKGGPIFPPWFDKVVKIGGAFALLGAVWYGAIFVYAASPRTLNVGYQPEQPVKFSHATHAGKLGMDCRYCHNTVERTAKANLPPTDTCMNCHAAVLKDDELLVGVQESHATGKPIKWIRVHSLGDYAYFNHRAHVMRGVGCVTCHGRIDKMEVVTQEEPLSMGWCLDCHRAPEKNLRPQDQITSMEWMPEEDPEVLGKKIREERNIHPSTSCSVCHR